MLIPNVGRATFNQMIKELESSLIENNETLQSVYDAKQGVWGIVKYDDSVSTISNQFQVLKRGVYTIRKKGMNIRLPTIILKPRNQLQIRKSLKARASSSATSTEFKRKGKI